MWRALQGARASVLGGKPLCWKHRLCRSSGLEKGKASLPPESPVTVAE